MDSERFSLTIMTHSLIFLHTRLRVVLTVSGINIVEPLIRSIS